MNENDSTNNSSSVSYLQPVRLQTNVYLNGLFKLFKSSQK